MEPPLPDATPDGFPRVKPCPKLMQRGHGVCFCEDGIWARILSEYQSHKVFLNIPYTEEYLDTRHLLVALVSYLRFTPVLALQEPREDYRLCKLCELIQQGPLVISDLSDPALHNIPLEFGLGFGLGRSQLLMIEEHQKYETFQVNWWQRRLIGKRTEAFRRRPLDVRASDLRPFDEIVTYRRDEPRSLIQGVLNRFQSPVLSRMLVSPVPQTAPALERFVEAILQIQPTVKGLFERYRHYRFAIQTIHGLVEKQRDEVLDRGF